MNIYPVKRALLSVSNKTGIVDFARQLHALGVEIISTGGTSAVLRDNNIPVQDVADLTGFPEIMEGRVKTLHPLIHGAILGKRDDHADVAEAHGIGWIDLLVVNLYPFAEVTREPDCSLTAAIENIDIGGPAMIRSAAKNMAYVSVVVSPDDYETVIQQIRETKAPPLAQRQAFAQKAFLHTAQYDALIYHYLAERETQAPLLPSTQWQSLEKITALRYGENPHQQACAYRINAQQNTLLDAPQYQGKALSYNNIVDAAAALNCVRAFEAPSCVIVKHANPCGVASADTPLKAFEKALAADKTSAFGGIIALNRPCDAQTATLISEMFFELLIAPGFSAEALHAFSSRPNLRLMDMPASEGPSSQKMQYQYLDGMILAQESNTRMLSPESLQLVTQAKPASEELNNLLFAWNVVQHVKSNAIVITKEAQTLGIGPGQVSRIDAVDLAIRKAGKNARQAGLASDAFFPFSDSISSIAAAGITCIIQPGGSIRDAEVIDACNAHGIAMVFTGIRCFRH